MSDRQKELSDYRLQQAEESLNVAKNCLKDGYYKDSVIIPHFMRLKQC